jgi:hypothetical protein
MTEDEQTGGNEQQWGGEEHETGLYAQQEEAAAISFGRTDMDVVDVLVSLSGTPEAEEQVYHTAVAELSIPQVSATIVAADDSILHGSAASVPHSQPMAHETHASVPHSQPMAHEPPASVPESLDERNIPQSSIDHLFSGEEVQTCINTFSGSFSTPFISHLLHHVDVNGFHQEQDPADDADDASMQPNEHQSSSLSEDAHSSDLSDGCISWSEDSVRNEPLRHSFLQASSLNVNDLGSAPFKILIDNVMSKDVSCMPDIDGYRLLLSKGVAMHHHLKVRYTPQDIEHRPQNVSFKIGSHRVSGKKLFFYRIGKVANIDCKVFVCIAFFKQFPKSVHSATRSIHASVCKALREADNDAPTRELSIRHGDSFGQKGKHILHKSKCQAFLNAVIRYCQRIQFPNVGDYCCGIVLERFGQKQLSDLNGGEECDMLEYITSLQPPVLLDGCVDIGMMFRSSDKNCRITCLWDRNTLNDLYGKRVRLHAKSFLGQCADGTVKHGVSNPVQKEKFYTSDVYLWRLQGKIPFRLLDASSSFLLSIPMFNEGLSFSMRNLLSSNGGASEQDINLVRQAFADLSDREVQARYEITIHAQHFCRYRAGVLSLCRLVPTIFRSTQLPCIRFVHAEVYASYLSRFATHLVDASESLRSRLRDQLFTKACQYQSQESGYGRVFSGTEQLLASLCVYQDLFILLLTGDSIYLRFRRLMNRLGIAEQMRQHGIIGIFDPATIDRVLSNSPNLFDYNSFFYAWAYPLIKRRASSAARDLVCFRLSAWFESCILFAANRLSLDTYAHRLCVSRRVVNQLMKELLILIELKNTSGKVSKESFFTSEVLTSFGCTNHGPIDVNAYVLNMFPKRISYFDSVTKILSSAALLSLATINSEAFESLRKTVVERMVGMYPCLKLRYYINCLPLFKNPLLVRGCPTHFCNVVVNAMTPSPECSLLDNPIEYQHAAEAKRQSLWLVEAVKRRIVTVLKPVDGPLKSYERIVEAFYALLRFQVGLESNYERAQKAMESAVKSNRKKDLEALEIFDPQCFRVSRCTSWRLIPFTRLVNTLHAHSNDVERAALELQCETHLPVFTFDARHSIQTSLTTEQAAKKRGRPRKRTINDME